jgi:hypothetical protein
MFASNKRIDKYRDEARQAMQDGQVVYTTYLPAGATRTGVQEWAGIIEAIEAEGWQLTHWTVDQSYPYPVFRKPQ